MKRTLLLSLTLLLAALLLLSACAGDNSPAGDSTDPATTGPAETEPPVNLDRLTDKYDADVNGITAVAGTFTCSSALSAIWIFTAFSFIFSCPPYATFIRCR